MVSTGQFIRRSLVAGFTAAAVAPASISDAEAKGKKLYTVGDITSQPVGHYYFCKEHKAECNVRDPDPKPLRITGKIWTLMVDINNEVNTSVNPKTDFDMHGKEEVWSYPKKDGDCEDYVLEKRRSLIAKGIPASSLLITVVKQKNGDGHAVLTAKTDRGDFILDNLEPHILVAGDTEYKFLKRVSDRHSGRWVSLNSISAVATASTNGIASPVAP